VPAFILTWRGKMDIFKEIEKIESDLNTIPRRSPSEIVTLDNKFEMVRTSLKNLVKVVKEIAVQSVKK